MRPAQCRSRPAEHNLSRKCLGELIIPPAARAERAQPLVMDAAASWAMAQVVHVSPHLVIAGGIAP
jgi:hypothetical protein